MLTFQEAIDTLDEDEKPSILLANGFSQAWDAAIFNYANLLEAADFGDRERVIRPLFENLGTYDFELIMKQLVAAEAVLNAYGAGEELIQNIVSDKEVLKESLITAISSTHPDLPGEVEDNQYVAVRTFLSQFNKIFSINYDLLFYWARNKYNLAPENYSTDDGFRAQRCWEGYGTNQEVHFLHGGLHIYDTGSYIKKHACTDDGITIIEQVRNNLNAGNFPLFVSEPTYQKKKQRIDHNPYLNYCYQALGDLSGTLFIHGHSMDENDKHIFNQIKSSRVSKIFVSIYGNENTEPNTRTKANALAFLQRYGVEVDFYQAESAPVWA
ncbi:DUF4917 family protein [Shewanella sp. AS16]|uniref:DUF4917 family protein n=1 Tax=Shewanella sp. AS16 TaxID=2907625 RepID=UPI001F16738E|nr:DUF4917 family protein [Shewanella sp. AS16]MCE9686143.1 DUF4917 family protein [Shewanella sp. AS16]